jgi:hypothetical protein
MWIAPGYQGCYSVFPVFADVSARGRKMFKIVVVAVVLTLVYLFYPRYDLYQKVDSFSEAYSLKEKGYWSKEACQKAGRTGKQAHRCISNTPWREMMGTQHEYNRERQY